MAAPDGGDARLVRRMVSGDPAAWEEWQAAYSGLVASVCRSALLRAGLKAGPDEVQDATAEVSRSLLHDGMRLLRAYRTGVPLGAYLRVIARTRTLNAARRLAPWPCLPEGEAEPASEDLVAEAIRLSERAARVRKAMGGLPPRDAEALRLFHLEGMDYATLAGRLGVPAAQVGVLLKRAREKMREVLGRDFPDSV